MNLSAKTLSHLVSEGVEIVHTDDDGNIRWISKIRVSDIAKDYEKFEKTIDKLRKALEEAKLYEFSTPMCIQISPEDVAERNAAIDKALEE